MVRIKIKRKPPGYHTAQLVLVPAIAAVLAIGSCVAQEDEESSWNSPTTSTSTEMTPQLAKKPVVPSATYAQWMNSYLHELQVPRPRPPAPTATASFHTLTDATAGPGPSTSPGSRRMEPSDLQEQRNFSARLDNRSESIQLAPCQRSSAACFAAGGLDTLTDNLDGLAIDPDTGHFCFSFQEGCIR
jgi:hypothetical protein